MRFEIPLCLSLLAGILLGACAPSAPSRPPLEEIAGFLESAPADSTTPALPPMGYCTQVGAFGSLENAVRLQSVLERRGIDAFYFLHESGLYKVRFGNHASYGSARSEADALQAQGLIGDFFIVSPEDSPAARIANGSRGDLREELVRTALGFIGIPYRWGGTSAEKGFDCSGLTLVCYRLNGLDLPRVSYNQYGAGRAVDPERLKKGDLVFFATNGGKRVSHVGMYIGDGQFVHAPRRGQTVRIESLSNGYYRQAFVGARSYL